MMQDGDRYVFVSRSESGTLYKFRNVRTGRVRYVRPDLFWRADLLWAKKPATS